MTWLAVTLGAFLVLSAALTLCLGGLALVLANVAMELKRKAGD